MKRKRFNYVLRKGFSVYGVCKNVWVYNFLCKLLYGWMVDNVKWKCRCDLVGFYWIFVFDNLIIKIVICCLELRVCVVFFKIVFIFKD